MSRVMRYLLSVIVIWLFTGVVSYLINDLGVMLVMLLLAAIATIVAIVLYLIQ